MSGITGLHTSLVWLICHSCTARVCETLLIEGSQCALQEL